MHPNVVGLHVHVHVLVSVPTNVVCGTMSPSNQPFVPTNKVIVVSGGGSGIGAALCKAFAAGGASAIIVADIDLSKAQGTCRDVATIFMHASHLTPSKTRMLPKKVDVTSDEQIHRLIEWVEYDVGAIDLFFCNAGIMPHPDNPELNGATAKKGVFATNEEIQQVMDVNFVQLVLVARHLIPRYLQRGKGHFCITASAAGLCPIGSMSYAVSKAAAVQFGNWLSVTYGLRGVGVCLLCPQRTRTDMTRGFTDNKGDWLGQMVEPDDAASCCLDALREGRMFAFPHPEVETYVQRKAADPDRWLLGMRRLNESVTFTAEAASKSKSLQPQHRSKL